jgi:hypothetical protein
MYCVMRIHQQLSSNYVLYYIWLRSSEKFMLVLAIKSYRKCAKTQRNKDDALSKPLLTYPRTSCIILRCSGESTRESKLKLLPGS